MLLSQILSLLFIKTIILYGSPLVIAIVIIVARTDVYYIRVLCVCAILWFRRTLEFSYKRARAESV